MRHDAVKRDHKITAHFQIAVDARYLIPGLITLSASGIEKHLLRLFIITFDTAHGDANIMVISRRLQRNIGRVKGRHIENHGLITQIEHGNLVQRIVIRARNEFDTGIKEAGVSRELVPPAGAHRAGFWSHSRLVINVVHGHVLV